MNEDYLWDRSGAPDAEIARLEQVLGELRWRSAKPRRELWRWMAAAVAAAAAVVFAIGAAIFVARMHTSGAPTSWKLSLGGEQPSTVRTGQVITQGTIESEFVGEVRVEPESHLRLLAARSNEQRLALDHGTIHALIWAPPAQFVVDTPAAKTVDLGCRYTLRVEKDGTGFLTVQMGWVAFQWRNLESFIPAGAACTTRPGHGPDTPYFLDAPRGLVGAVTRFDLTNRSEELEAVLRLARPRDGLTLWHLLERTRGAERADVYERFAALVNLPNGVTRDGILAGDRKAMDAAWDALQLGDTGWWREWKRQW